MPRSAVQSAAKVKHIVQRWPARVKTAQTVTRAAPNHHEHTNTTLFASHRAASGSFRRRSSN
eukprot:2811287-Alexandrium_andersonii.AAC.1